MSQEEIKRLSEDRSREKNWKRWGPYLSERQWATVREDYSADGKSWNYFTHEQSRMRSYRWGEDGLLGITDRECRLCFALALWNGKDRILKERIFGLTSTEGNHGEDVKDYYFYLDSTPTHSYMKALYKYPHAAFPYELLVEENQKRGLSQPEFELWETGIFDQKRYCDVYAEYAKQSADAILIRVTLVNRSSESVSLHVIPTLWFRNTWSWGGAHEWSTEKLSISKVDRFLVESYHPTLGHFFLAYEPASDGTIPDALFTENESNLNRLYGAANKSAYVKDGFHDYIIHGIHEAVNFNEGSKFGAHYTLSLNGGETKTISLCLYSESDAQHVSFGNSFEKIFSKRKEEADAFYASVISKELSQEDNVIARQAYASLLWTKQFYHFVVQEWLNGDPAQPPPPETRKNGRNREWTHIYCRDVISMPDKWEYPWFASWDLAFHMLPFASIDPQFAKEQIILMLREWYMHPNGQQPAYEFEFSDVNPPVHAWAAWRVYKIAGKNEKRDIEFLESAFQKLLLNFTWWVNRKDREGHNLFSGGFLGLDNIGVFDRSKLHPGTYLEQADGTAWMAFYCLTMLTISLELAVYNPVYEDMASKFFEHFIFIADAINRFEGHGLWDEEDGFYYDLLKLPEKSIYIKLRSLVGLIPLIAVEILKEEHIQKLPGFQKRMAWFLKNRKDLEGSITYCEVCEERGHRILAIPSPTRLTKILQYLLDESEFLSPYGVRSLSKIYQKNPYILKLNNEMHEVQYTPGTSNTYLFGGNSNWRGPIWFPLNFLIIEALERYHHFYGDEFTIECPTGSGNKKNLKEVANVISWRLCKLFQQSEGSKPCFGQQKYFREDPYWKNLLLFNEYFHAETGEGLGAEHQTGWTALITRILENWV